ncbi:MAG: hypothetical protein AAF191_17820, partial [Verrucomicrobiota bacterium]
SSSLLGQEPAETIEIGTHEMEKLKTFENEIISVVGHIVGTDMNATGIHFVRFRGSDFVAITFPRFLPNFPSPPSEAYTEGFVRVTGKIELYRGKPQVRFERPEELEVLDFSQWAKGRNLTDLEKSLAEVAPSGLEEAPLASVEGEPTEADEPSASLAETEEETSPAVPEDAGPLVEVVNGKPALNWRLYFPE